MDSFVAIKSSMDEAKRVFYSVVLTPDKEDYDKDVYSAKDIERVAHDWMENYRYFDTEHDFIKNEGVSVVESYLTNEPKIFNFDGEDVELGAGTWILGVKINDDDVLDKVLSGKIRGVSIAAFKEKDREAVEKALKSKGGRTSVADLGDWFTYAVSLVEDPAVADARIFALKNKSEDQGEKSFTMTEFVNAIKNAFNKDKKEEGVIDVDKMTTEEFEQAVKSIIQGMKDEDEVSTKSKEEKEDEEKLEDVDTSTKSKEEEEEEESELEVALKSMSDMKSEFDEMVTKMTELEKSVKGTRTSLGEEDVETVTKSKSSFSDKYDVLGRPKK